MHSRNPRRGVVGSTYPALQWGNEQGYQQRQQNVEKRAKDSSEGQLGKTRSDVIVRLECLGV
jgi:hypothetical protein